MKKLVLMAVAAVAVSASVTFVSCDNAPKAADSIANDVIEVCDSVCDSVEAEVIDTLTEVVDSAIAEVVEE